MIDYLKKIIWKPEGMEHLKTPANREASFVLIYDKLTVGELRLKDGKWLFEYSTAFKQQSEVKPIVDFPDLDKKYEAEELWPFFASRIPSLNQPAVQEVIREEKLKEDDLVDLLKFFGKLTITNPFKLVSS